MSVDLIVLGTKHQIVGSLPAYLPYCVFMIGDGYGDSCPTAIQHQTNQTAQAAQERAQYRIYRDQRKARGFTEVCYMYLYTISIALPPKTKEGRTITG